MKWRRLWRFETPGGLLALSIFMLAWEITAVFFLWALAALLGELPLLLYAAGTMLLVLPVLYLGLALLDFVYRGDEPSEPAVAGGERITDSSVIGPNVNAAEINEATIRAALVAERLFREKMIARRAYPRRRLSGPHQPSRGEGTAATKASVKDRALRADAGTEVRPPPPPDT